MTRQMTRLSTSELYGQVFDRASLTKRGYDSEQVDRLIERVRAELQRRDQDKDSLLGERSALEQENASLRVKLGHLDANAQAQLISDQAVHMMSTAQRQVEQYWAEVESQCHQMTREARDQCEGILGQARQQAQTILDDAHRTASAAGDMAATAYRAASVGMGYETQKEEMERQLAYMQTFSTVWRSQLRNLFATLSQQVEQWPPDAPPIEPYPQDGVR